MNRHPLVLRATQGTLAFFVRLAKGVFSVMGSVFTFALSAIAHGVDYEDEYDVEEKLVVQPEGTEQFESFVVPKRHF